MWCRPESTNIDRGGAEVIVGIFRSTLHHFHCLNSQQLFYYIISLSKQSNNNNNTILAMAYGLDIVDFLFLTCWLTDFIQLMYDLFVITTADREDAD